MSKRKDQVTLLERESFTPEEALICTMVLVSAADGAITDREIGAMAGLVQTLPAFEVFSSDDLNAATEATVLLLGEDEGLAHAARLIRNALEPRLRETAYALSCDIVAAEKIHTQPVLQMLEFVGQELRIDPLVLAAIERGARARHQRIRLADTPGSELDRPGNRPASSHVARQGGGDAAQRRSTP